jgi:hypothetical protein
VLYLQHTVSEALRRHPTWAYPVVFLDISRAFDSVPHELLLVKLFREGVRGDLLLYFAAFLDNRRFRVVSGSLVGRWALATAGVPQGAVNSPPLYSVFINDALPERSRRDAFVRLVGKLLFADDGTLAPPIEAPVAERCRQLQLALDALGEWAALWGVRFSAAKSGCVWFHSRHVDAAALASAAARDTALVIPYGGAAHRADANSVRIPAVRRYQYLGVWLDATLSPHAQFEHLRAKLAVVSAMLRSCVVPDGPPDALILRTLVRTLAVPLLAYSLPFLPLTNAQCDKLNALLLRPLLSRCRLPPHVHRASAAHYFDVPVVQVLQQTTLLQLVASQLRLANDNAVRAAPERHPAALLVLERCSLAAVQQRANAALRADSPFDRFAVAVRAANLERLLPTLTVQQLHSDGPRWPLERAFANGVAEYAQRATLERLLLESRGHAVRHEPLVFNELDEGGGGQPRGALYPPLLGVQPTTTDVGELCALCTQEGRAANALHTGPAPSLAFDTPRHAMHRARLTLNRESAWLAVRNTHNPLAPQDCAHCSQRFGGPVRETALHAVSVCARNTERRRKLLRRLRPVLLRLRACRLRPQWSQLLATREQRLFHCVAATPFVLSLLNDDRTQQLRLCRLTGNYLDGILRDRPAG